jgi:DNA polymerase-1
VLVKADYSQIELRIAAQITGDPRMVRAFQAGLDLHELTARLVLNCTEEVSKEIRQRAKALNFGLLYGMGAETFQRYAFENYGVQLTPVEAQQLRSRWFYTFPRIRLWHLWQPKGSTETRTLAGRRRLNLERFTEKLNTPVQGTGADGLKNALALLWETRHRCPSARLVLVVHDEIVVECDEQEAEPARQWLVESMQKGMSEFLRHVPVEVEAKVCRDWSVAD